MRNVARREGRFFHILTGGFDDVGMAPSTGQHHTLSFDSHVVAMPYVLTLALSAFVRLSLSSFRPSLYGRGQSNSPASSNQYGTGKV